MRLDELFESVVDVAIQGRVPGSPGSMGLMRSRADYGRSIHNVSGLEKGAVDALCELLHTIHDPEKAVEDVSFKFRMEPDHLKSLFRKHKQQGPADYHRQYKKQAEKAPAKI